MGDWELPVRCCEKVSSSTRLRSAANASPSPIASLRCRNFCKDRGGHRRSIASPERAALTTKRFSRLKFGLTGSTWRQVLAARKKKPNSARPVRLSNYSNARKRKVEAEGRKKLGHRLQTNQRRNNKSTTRTR